MIQRVARRIPEWMLTVIEVAAIGFLVVSVVSGAGAAIALHRVNDSQEVRIDRAQAAIGELATTNRSQDIALEKANAKLRRMGKVPVAEDAVPPPFPFTFMFEVGSRIFTVTCGEPDLACLVQTDPS